MISTNQYWIHDLDPVLVHLGPLPIRWYGLMYILGFLAGIAVLAYRRKKGLLMLPSFEAVQDMVFYAFCAGLIGGRLGACLLYEPVYYLAHPLEILAVWKGGMSSHGGIGAGIIGLYIFSRKHHVSLVHLMDNMVIAMTPGLAFGRIGNFINGELWGKITTVPWAVIFPQIDMQPRHPVQLYQSLTEGILLFFLLMYIGRKKRPNGLLTGIFGVGYAALRIITEYFRAETPVLAGPAWLGITKGQIYSIIMLCTGIIFIIYSLKYRKSMVNG
jgi:phosphatidylglycerol:prolipoprotein diacylglycerol transferase